MSEPRNGTGDAPDWDFGRRTLPETAGEKPWEKASRRIWREQEQGFEAEAAAINPERLARALEASREHVNYPKRWGKDDFAWVARQVAAAYEREP